jgi:hypothetical protein
MENCASYSRMVALEKIKNLLMIKTAITRESLLQTALNFGWKELKMFSGTQCLFQYLQPHWPTCFFILYSILLPLSPVD